MNPLHRLLRWLRPWQPVELAWCSQHASWGPIDGSPLLQVARTAGGVFEIFEDGESFLLHFPRKLQMPAELFHSLAEAKARAEIVAKEARE